MSGAGRVVIAGGSGFLGTNLARALAARGDEVVLLSRHAPSTNGPWVHRTWDGRTVGAWQEELENASALVNLAGRSVDCRKTPDNCDEILRSRVDATRVLGRALREIATPPPVWVQMSTAHRYGDSLTAWCDEDSAFGYGLAPFVADAWETAFADAVPTQTRGVVLRTSFVLGRDRGALRRLARIARWGLGGRTGHGRQGISWIHEEDMNRLFLRAIDDASMHGAYIATAPRPVPNAEFMRELRRALGMPLGLPAAAWMVTLAAPLLRTDPELALYGRYCVPRRLIDDGFEFRYPDVRSALQQLYGSPGSGA
jgi:uncharacterized protein